jgi:molybdate transport system regulatory protein
MTDRRQPAETGAEAPRLRARLRIYRGEEIALGPGKADLLEAIAAEGSIAAAGRRLGMSYKRAWQLVETMNACFAAPLVETRRGGSAQGGAILTEGGHAALSAYRRMQALSEAAVAAEMDALLALMRRDA